MSMCVSVDLWTHLQMTEAYDPLELELQVVGAFRYGCWELNLGPLQKLYVALTAAPPLQLQALNVWRKMPYWPIEQQVLWAG